MALEFSFYENVYELCKLIPSGRVTSYGAIARYLGAARSARAVGYALTTRSGGASVPAHRVLNRNGMLTGRHQFSTPTAMQEALEAEGIKVVDNQVVDFDKVYWDPSLELL